MAEASTSLVLMEFESSKVVMKFWIMLWDIVVQVMIVTMMVITPN
jgi:hypothetical protein